MASSTAPVPGTSGAQDTFYVGTLKEGGRIYQQTFIDTYAKVAFAKGMSRSVLKFARQASLVDQARRPWLAVQGWGW